MPPKAISPVRASAKGRSRGPSVSSPSQRLSSLQRQHRTLLQKIASKQKEVERLKQQVEEAERQLHERVEPIAARCRSTNEEIWNMFQALLSSAGTKRARRAVREVFQALVNHGVVLPVEADADPDPDAGARGARAADDADDPRARQRPDRGGYSAAPRGAEPGRDVLKAVFKRLTLAFHPDRTQDAAEKLARTELMQRVTRAYQVGDLASLLQLERRAPAGGGTASAPEGAQCLELERAVDELRVQLSELKSETRRLERAEALQFFSVDVAGGSGKTLDRFVRTVEAELEELTRIRDFVAAFRDKELSLDEFLCGPVFEFGGAEFDFDDLVRGDVVEAAEPRGRARRAARRERRKR